MALPSGWNNQDTGTATGGTTTAATGVFSVHGTSAQLALNQTSDNLQIVYRVINSTTDASITVEQVNGFGSAADRGIFIRQNVAADAASAYLYFPSAGASGIKLASRISEGGALAIPTDIGFTSTWPYWLRLTFTAATNTVTAFISADGASYTNAGSVVIGFDGNFILGMFADNCGTGVVAQFTQVVVVGSTVPPDGGLYPQPGSPGSIPGANNNEDPTSNTGATNILGYAPGSLTGVNAGSTSNVTGWIPDILTMAQEAAELASVDATSAYFLRSTKRSLDLLSMGWANKGLNLWTLEQLEQVLTPGVPSYNLPQDTIDLVGPAIRTNNGGTNIDIMVARQDFLSYLSIPNKAFQGKPNTVFVDRRTFIPKAWMWPTPNSAQTYTLIYWRLKRMQNTGYATNLMEVPFRFCPALIAGLAYQLAMKKKVKDYNLIAMLKANYKELFQDAIHEDRDRSPVYFAPYQAWR